MRLRQKFIRKVENLNLEAEILNYFPRNKKPR